MSSSLLDYHAALATLLQTHSPVTRTQELPLAELNGRILAHDVAVQLDVPGFDNSAMDGYAINGNDLRQWRVVQRIVAGDTAAVPSLQVGQAARIFTGAPVPQGATAVIMQEDVQRHDDGAGGSEIVLTASVPVKDGQHIRRRAEELQTGRTLLAQGARMTPATIGLLAGQGYTHACVQARVRVAVLSSGNELVPPGQPLKPGQIYDSNRIMLCTWLNMLGFEAVDCGALPDQLATTRAALQAAAQTADAVLCSGGVSVGEEDHLKAALEEAGTLTQWRLAIKPGKPFTWGHIPGRQGLCRVFMLPGNPVSSLVTFQQLALPALQRMAGCTPEQARPVQWLAKANFQRSKADSRREFVRVSLTHSPGQGWLATPLAQQGSNMLSGAAFANALLEVPPGASVAQGDALVAYPLFATTAYPGL